MTHSSVEECQQRISWDEFNEWFALYRMEPWGDEWSQVRAIAASNLAPHTKRLRLDKFFPQRKKPAAEMEAEMTRWARLHNRRVNRGG